MEVKVTMSVFGVKTHFKVVVTEMERSDTEKHGLQNALYTCITKDKLTVMKYIYYYLINSTFETLTEEKITSKFNTRMLNFSIVIYVI